MTLYRLRKGCGDHVEVDKKGKAHHIKVEETFESHRDLIAKFCKGNPDRCKFVKVYPDDVIEPDKAPNIPLPGAIANMGGDDAHASSPNIHPEYGEDITSEFPLAVEKEVKVYVKKHWCQVVDETEDGEEVLNDAKLRKKHVDEFLKDLEEIEEEEEDEEE